MEQKQINSYKKYLRSETLFAILMTISFILMVIGWLNTNKIHKWVAFYTLATFIFLFFILIFHIVLSVILGFKIRSTARREKSKASEINVMFLKIFNIIMTAIILPVNLSWLILACWYYLEMNIIQAIFMIIISVSSFFYICYCFYYYFKIKNSKIKMTDILNEKSQWWYLRKINFDQENKD